MKEIPIQKKVEGNYRYADTIVRKIIGYTIIDDEYYSDLNQYTWTLSSPGYPQRTERKKNILMHHDIWCRLKGRPYMKLDHIDRNKLNNQLSNFRPATNSQNLGNRGLFKNSTTGFKGVSYNKKYKKYVAYIMINRKSLFLGYFSTTIEAAKAYDTAAIKHFGEFAATNETLGLLTKPEEEESN